jgi:polyhydroxyalkanoate synthase subunit PhaC
MGAKDKTFVLSQSGHIAGIINPPSKGKYGHYTNAAPVQGDADDWKAGAGFNQGSWWPRWADWLAGRSGALIAARIPGDSTNAVICDAPGSYVVSQGSLSPKG